MQSSTCLKSMTTAYDFPDLNISPILGEEESDNETDEQNPADLPGSHHMDVPLQDVLKGLSISESDPSRNALSSGASDVESCTDAQRRPACLYGNTQRGDSFDSSSEGAFAALECEMKRSLFSVAESCDFAADLQESFCSILSGMLLAICHHFANFLQFALLLINILGCRVNVEMGCCTESSADVRSRLRRMGAVVSRRFTETTTHVVFSFGGRAAILRHAFSLTKRPFLVDPHWVYECFNTQTHVPEEQYSLYDCRFLVSALRRSLDSRCVSENGNLTHANNNDVPTTASTSHVEGGLLARSALTELLAKIDLLSRRLDRIGAAPCVLGNRCPSAMKGKLHTNGVSKQFMVKEMRKIPVSGKVLRRRTLSAFPLEYREPFSTVVQLYRESRDEENAICGRLRRMDLDENNDNKENEGSNSVKVPRKHNTQHKRREPLHVCIQSQKCLAAIENSSEMGGLLGFRAPFHGGAYAPLVETASSMINHLQLASTSEEFVKKKQAPVVARSRNGIVFTGFFREKERELHSTASELRLKVQTKINARTYCVVSANGDRTLNTLRAVVSGIPVVKTEWVLHLMLVLKQTGSYRWINFTTNDGRDCISENKVLEIDGYMEHDVVDEIC
ncbi:BRCA1 protein [Ostertagia ostertagi]